MDANTTMQSAAGLIYRNRFHRLLPIARWSSLASSVFQGHAARNTNVTLRKAAELLACQPLN